jgi:hypothetical protein
VCMIVCSLIAQERLEKCPPNLVYLFVEIGIAYKRVKVQKIALSSSPGEGRSCSSETKHDRGTAPRTKFFVPNIS